MAGWGVGAHCNNTGGSEGVGGGAAVANDGAQLSVTGGREGAPPPCGEEALGREEDGALDAGRDEVGLGVGAAAAPSVVGCCVGVCVGARGGEI